MRLAFWNIHQQKKHFLVTSLRGWSVVPPLRGSQEKQFSLWLPSSTTMHKPQPEAASSRNCAKGKTCQHQGLCTGHGFHSLTLSGGSIASFWSWEKCKRRGWKQMEKPQTSTGTVRPVLGLLPWPSTKWLCFIKALQLTLACGLCSRK